MITELIEWRETPERLIRPAVIAAVVLLSLYLGGNPSFSSLVPFVALTGAIILMRVPEAGLLALLVGALCVPFVIGTGTQTELNPGILIVPVLISVWLLDMIRHRSIKLFPSPTNFPLLLFGLSATLSLFAGNLPWKTFAHAASLPSQIGGWSVFVFSAGLFLFVGNQVGDLHWLRWLTFIFLIVAAAAVIALCIPRLELIGAVAVDDVQRESMFWVWIVAIAGGIALFNRSLSLPLRLALAVLAVATFVGGWIQRRYWVSGWFPPLTVLLALVWLRSWRVGLVVTVIGFVVILVLRPDLIASVAGLKQYSTDTRLAAWEILLADIIPISPIIGLGPANYYFYTPLVPILGYYVNFNSHSQYIDLLAQTGIVGLVLYGWSMFAIAKLGWMLRERVGDGFARGYVYACLAGLAGTIIAGWLGDWVLPFVYNIGLAGFRASMLPWMFAGGLVAIQRLAVREPSISVEK